MNTKNNIAPPADAIPPGSARFEGESVFTERFVIMRGQDYYMRVFHSGASEFVRYDEAAKKWVFLCFPAEGGQSA